MFPPQAPTHLSVHNAQALYVTIWYYLFESWLFYCQVELMLGSYIAFFPLLYPSHSRCHIWFSLSLILRHSILPNGTCTSIVFLPKLVLAALSATSFPSTPTCAVTHKRPSLPPCLSNLETIIKIYLAQLCLPLPPPMPIGQIMNLCTGQLYPSLNLPPTAALTIK